MVTDLEALYQYVKEDVKSQDDGSLYPEYEETLEAMFQNGSGDEGQLEWIMDRDGITVVFNPYVCLLYTSYFYRRNRDGSL